MTFTTTLFLVRITWNLHRWNLQWRSIKHWISDCNLHPVCELELSPFMSFKSPNFIGSISSQSVYICPHMLFMLYIPIYLYIHIHTYTFYTLNVSTSFFLPLIYIWQVCPVLYGAFHGHNVFAVTLEVARSFIVCSTGRDCLRDPAWIPKSAVLQ